MVRLATARIVARQDCDRVLASLPIAALKLWNDLDFADLIAGAKDEMLRQGLLSEDEAARAVFQMDRQDPHDAG